MKNKIDISSKISELEDTVLKLGHALDSKGKLISDLTLIIARQEVKLSYQVGGSLAERTAHCLNEFETISRTSILKTKDFIDDVKTQFKALELVVEGISSEAYNHTQKRVIANHVINLLRGMVERINKIDFDYSDRIYDRYDWFRSQTPERELYRKYRELKQEVEQYRKTPVPDLLNNNKEEIPF